MKNLFFVHSPITVLVSKLVIQFLKIPANDVLFLTARGAHLDNDEYKTVEFPYVSDEKLVPQTRNVFHCAEVLQNFDSFLETLVGKNQFYCYVPQNTLRGIELLINAPQCAGFNIIEEGSASYYPIDYLNKEYGNSKASIWDRIGYKNRIRRKYFFRPDYKAVYGITDEAFPGFRNRCILPVHTLKSNAYEMFDNQAILIYDDIILSDILEKAAVCRRINHLLKKETRFDKLYYKFHPRHTDEQKDAIRKLMYRDISLPIEELPNTFSVELLVVNAKCLTFMMNLSSLGLYAGIFGHQVYSFAPWLYEVEMHPELLYGKVTGYEDFVNEMPEVYKKNVAFLPKEFASGTSNENNYITLN